MLFLWKKSYDQPRRHIKKQRHYFANKGPSNPSPNPNPNPRQKVKAMVFPVSIYGGESWTIKKAEHWRIDAFELWCWRRLLKVPWTARRSSPSIVKEISDECSLEGLIIRLKPPDAKNWLIWKDPDAGKDWRREEKGTAEDEIVGWYNWLDGHEFE